MSKQRYAYTVLCALLPALLFAEKITISACGDIMAHVELQEYAQSSHHNYDRLFTHLTDIFSHDDLTIANLETPLSDRFPISGYPAFSAKTALADSIKAAGIDLLSCANNHSYDKHNSGVISTYTALHDRGIIFHGIGRTRYDSEKFLIINRGGISIALYSLTFSLNGIKQKRFISSSPYINYYPPADRAALRELTEKIRNIKHKVDLIIILYHGGTEYAQLPDPSQELWVQSCIDAGADIVLCHHPHVLQKAEYFKNKQGETKLVIYSLGNLVSGQARYKTVKNPMPDYSDEKIRTSEGAVLQFDIVKWNSTVQILNPRFIPLFTLAYKEPKEDKKAKPLYCFETFPMKEIMELPDNDPQRGDLTSVKEIIKVRREELKKLLGIPVADSY